LQLLSTAPAIIADASHNVAGCANLLQSLQGFVRPEECVVIASILKDKDQAGMLDYYASLSDCLITCNLPQQSRATSALALAKASRGKFKQIHVYNSPLFALQAAKQLQKKLIIISGSTYLLKYFVGKLPC
jgi:folylpolyglutamate synthase/dihydropteroate synthase